MAKSNGIKDLKQAAKLLNKHAPDGEKLAYINQKEAELLRAHGGSGIMTLAGVPSYWSWEDAWKTAKEWGGKAMEFVGWKDDKGDIDIGEIGKDAFAVLAGLKAKKDREGLNKHEMAQFNKLNQQLAAAETEFNINVAGGPSVTNVPTTIEDVASYTDVTLPTMKTTAVAEGGRIGYNIAGPVLSEEQTAMVKGMLNKNMDTDTISTLTGVTTDQINMIIKQIEEAQKGLEQSGALEKIINLNKAQGGRIGYNLGGIGAMDPRMGYQNAGEVENFNWGGPDMIEWATAREKGMDADPLFASRIMKLEGEHEQDVAEHEGAALFDKAWDLVNRGIAEDINHALQMLRGEMNQPMGAAYGGRIGAQKGGIMPLLNLGGMEKDYRQDGGFVPIGRREKADDVPARLSKNEFVFTADAVRAAGGGDIDQGAQRMYNVMKNLEAGGEISEQSQGKA